MSPSHFRFTKGELEHLDHLRILSNDPLFHDVLGYSSQLGYFSAQLMEPEGISSPEEALAFAKEIDQAAGAAEGQVALLKEGLSLKITTDTVHDTLITSALQNSNGMKLYPDIQLDEIRDLIKRILPAESQACFFSCTAVGTNPENTMNFLSSGDTEARRQAMISYPMALSGRLEDLALRARIDRREEISGYLAEKLELSPAQMRVYARFEQAVSESIFRTEDDEFPRKIMRALQRGYAATGKPRLCDFKEMSVNAAGLIRLDQLPAPQDPQFASDTLHAIGAVNAALVLQRYHKLGPSPITRVLRRIAAGDWAKAKQKIEQQTDNLTTFSDYTNGLSKNLHSAFIVSQLRDDPVFELDKISEAATRVLEDDALTEEEARKLNAFIDELSNASMPHPAGYSQAISENCSLKTLSELNTRWHHTQQQTDNKLMAGSTNIDWEPLLGNLDLGHAAARELCSSQDLIEQGDKEKHCVGSYVSHVLGLSNRRDISVLFSIEKPQGEILSTVELRIDPNAPAESDLGKWSITQHFAARNTKPSEEAVAAAEALCQRLDMIPIKEVEQYVQRTRTNTSSMKRRLSQMIARYGANICDPNLPESMLEVITPTLPKALRGRNIEELHQLIVQHQPGKYADALTTSIEKLKDKMATLKNEVELTPND